MCTDHDTRPAPVEAATEPGEWRGEVIPLEPVDSISVLTVCDNAVDVLLPDQEPARRLSLGFDAPRQLEAATLEEGKLADYPIAQHGFATLVTVRKADRQHRFLFDTGITPDGCVDNLDRLGQDPATIEAIVCSHGHFDHTTGLSGLARAVGPRNLPVLIHPDFWLRRRVAIPGRDPIELPTTSRQGLGDAGFDVIERGQPSFLFSGSLLVTGEVDRTTEFERGMAVHQALRNGSWEPDPLVLDDQALIAHVRGKGLVVLTGCGHAGIVNICRYARRLTGTDRLHAVIGGFHLGGPLFEPVIGPTVEALADMAPDVVVPAHCTGWRAQHALAARLPDAFITNSVGTTFTFEATIPGAAGGPSGDPSTVPMTSP